MNHKHFRQILISNNIFPLNLSETKLALKLVTQKEKFILEDSVKAIKSNSKYTKQKMNKSEVLNALEDLKILLGYNNIFDVKSIELKYNDF
jgi:hypothetical protein